MREGPSTIAGLPYAELSLAKASYAGYPTRLKYFGTSNKQGRRAIISATWPGTRWPYVSIVKLTAHAIGGHDEPKDTDDLCCCLDQYPDGTETLAAQWKQRASDANIAKAVEIRREKLARVDSFGPQQLVEFHDTADADTRKMHARRAFQLVEIFLGFL